MNNHTKHEDQTHSNKSGDEIVLHQEKLMPTMLLALVFVLLTLFGLSQAGKSDFNITLGKDAYDKVQNEKISLEKKNHEAALNKEKNPHGEIKAGEEKMEAPANKTDTHNEESPSHP